MGRPARAGAVERFRAFGEDWPRALDSIRPISQALWIEMDEPLRRSFVERYRHEFDIHRHRVAAEIARDLDAWIETGRLEVHAAAIERVDRSSDGWLRIAARPGAGSLEAAASWDVDWVVLAIGPNTDPMANPLLGAAIRDGLMRPGPLGISIDSDAFTCRVLDRTASPACPPTPSARSVAASCGRRWRSRRSASSRRRSPGSCSSPSARRSGSRAAAGRAAGTAR